jgi:hypothetical protein
MAAWCRAIACSLIQIEIGIEIEIGLAGSDPKHDLDFDLDFDPEPAASLVGLRNETRHDRWMEWLFPRAIVGFRCALPNLRIQRSVENFYTLIFTCDCPAAWWFFHKIIPPSCTGSACPMIP